MEQLIKTFDENRFVLGFLVILVIISIITYLHNRYNRWREGYSLYGESSNDMPAVLKKYPQLNSPHKIDQSVLFNLLIKDASVPASEKVEIQEFFLEDYLFNKFPKLAEVDAEVDDDLMRLELKALIQKPSVSEEDKSLLKLYLDSL